MATNAPPSRDPANAGDMVGVLQQVLRKFLQSVDNALPARVLSYDRDAKRAQVQPLVRVMTTDGRQISRAPIASVPVMAFGGGDVVLSFNLVAGDLGWIHASDRDISLFLQNGQESAPNTLRMHSFDDAVFIPDVMRDYVITPEDAGNAVLQTRDGSVRIALWPDRIKLTAGALSLTIGPTDHVFEGHVIMPDGATISGREFLAHTHGNVTTGSGTSGGVT